MTITIGSDRAGTIYPDVQRQIESNKRRSTILVLAAVSNALAVALSVGLVVPALGIMLILLLFAWIVIAYRLHERTLLRSLQVRHLTAGERYRILPAVDRVATTLGIAPPQILVHIEAAPNAFAFGSGPNSTVVVTDCLLQLLSDDELEGVIAHECSHIANHDTEISALSAALIGWAIAVTVVATVVAISMLTWGVGMVFGRGDRDRDLAGILAGTIIGLLLIVLAILLWLSVRAWLLMSELTHLAISREREWLADATAVRATGKPLALAGALEKAAAFESMLPDHGRSAWTDSLTIFGAGRQHWWEKIFDTHPDIHDRIARLRSYAAPPLP